MNELKSFRKQKSKADEQITGAVLQIKTDDIRANKAQPRSDFNQNSIIRLADSIRRYGILQPLSVRECEPDDSYKYELIAGERRLRAARMLGYLTVPCVVMDTDDQTSAELAIIENLQREDLNMFEEAYGYKKLIEIHGLTQEEVARKMSSSQSAIGNKLRLLRLSYEEQKFVIESGLTERHVRTCLRIEPQERRMAVLKHVVEQKLNVSAAEAYVDELLSSDRSSSISVPSSTSSALKEKSLHDTVESIRKKVDTWIKSGSNAEININSKNNGVEIHITLHK